MQLRRPAQRVARVLPTTNGARAGHLSPAQLARNRIAARSAGRPAGAVTIRSRSYANQLAQTGMTPLERLDRNARWLQSRADHWRRVFEAETDPEKKRQLEWEAKLWTEATNIVLREMLPYCHPRLAAHFIKAQHQHNGPLIAYRRPGESDEQALKRAAREESSRIINHAEAGMGADGGRLHLVYEEGDEKI